MSEKEHIPFCEHCGFIGKRAYHQARDGSYCCNDCYAVVIMKEKPEHWEKETKREG